jgi:hypothetical protein
MFIDEEHAVERCTAVLLQDTAEGWAPSVMQLDCVATNYRLLLRPHRKKYAPASLPARYIQGIYMMQRGIHKCIALLLVTDHWLYITVATGDPNKLYKSLLAMRTPPRYRFNGAIARQDIERLITFFGREPLPERA